MLDHYKESPLPRHIQTHRNIKAALYGICCYPARLPGLALSYIERFPVFLPDPFPAPASLSWGVFSGKVR